MADVFVSYARPDRDRVVPLVALLEGTGWTVWWDSRIGGGERWDERIANELKAAKCVVVVWTPASVLSRWVITEASEALRHNKLVPVISDKVEQPLEFKLFQAVDMHRWSGDKHAECAVALNAAVQRFIAVSSQLQQNDQPRAAQFCDNCGGIPGTVTKCPGPSGMHFWRKIEPVFCDNCGGVPGRAVACPGPSGMHFWRKSQAVFCDNCGGAPGRALKCPGPSGMHFWRSN